MRLLSLWLQFIILLLANFELGTVTIASANVLILVLLNVISSITPSISDVWTQSPIENGLSKTITMPPNKLENVSWAANANAIPLIPRPVIKPVNPNSFAIITTAKITIAILIIIDTKGNTIPLESFLLCILLCKIEFSKV